MDKTLYQKIFEGYKCNNLIYEINPKKMFVWESQNKLQELQVSQNEIFGMTSSLNSCEIWTSFLVFP